MEDLEARIAAMKTEGLRRRARRTRRNQALIGAAVGVTTAALALGSLMTGEDGRGTLEAVAARNSNGELCRNDVDPACGPFRWEPQPAENRTATLKVLAPTARSGVPVSILVAWSDADASRAVPLICRSATESECPDPPEPCIEQDAHGPWTPPVRRGGSGEFKGLTTTFDEPGTYSLTVTLTTASWPEGFCVPPSGDPYADTVTKTVEIEVR